MKENNPRYSFDVKNPKTWNAIHIEPIPKRCDNELCRRTLPAYHPKDDKGKRYTTYHKYLGHNFCDKWCSFEYKTTTEIHPCNKCGKLTSPVYHKDRPQHIHYWNKRCEDCKLTRYKIPIINNV